MLILARHHFDLTLSTSEMLVVQFLWLWEVCGWVWMRTREYCRVPGLALPACGTALTDFFSQFRLLHKVTFQQTIQKSPQYFFQCMISLVYPRSLSLKDLFQEGPAKLSQHLDVWPIPVSLYFSYRTQTLFAVRHQCYHCAILPD